MAKIRVGELDVHIQRMSAVGAPAESPPPLVVLVHGLLIDSLASYYFSLGPAFAESGMDVLMYDLRGHGRTSRPAAGYRLEDFVSDLDELFDALGEDRPAHVVGNSFGGVIAYGLAAARPDRVRSVIAIESEPPMKAWAEKMAAGLTGKEGGLLVEDVRTWLAADPQRNPRPFQFAGRILESTTLREDLPRSRLLDDGLADIRCPVFALYGADSELSGQARRLAATLAHCRTVVLPDQGHSVLVERTKETADLISGWLADDIHTPLKAG
ncbi:alpha/beta fold hydrolase [Streptomyces sp. NPDC014735]|uniref:alpha/beta fold hydrolase n=1 Tax=unclassified Streptomyces TaxID=2593676 RepID=UPI00093E5F85|nr:alpha/beta hydrolase [Streptomyces sp. CB01580]OKJ39916.1 hydrolase [Streptomyces sp. CB01580]